MLLNLNLGKNFFLILCALIYKYHKLCFQPVTGSSPPLNKTVMTITFRLTLIQKYSETSSFFLTTTIVLY